MTQTDDSISGGKGEAGHGVCWMTARKLKTDSSAFAGSFADRNLMQQAIYGCGFHRDYSVSLPAIQKLMGNSTLAPTANIYAVLAPSELAEAVEKAE